MVLGDPSPWHPLDLPWDEAPGWEGVPWDREARPGLDEVLAVRAQRQATVRQVLDDAPADDICTGTSTNGDVGVFAGAMRSCSCWAGSKLRKST